MRSTEPWRKYSALITALSRSAGDSPLLTPLPDRVDAREKALLDELSRRLTPRHYDPAATELLNDLGIARTYYQRHLRAIASWPITLRTHLAAGASLRLLEEHRSHAGAQSLAGLDLSGTVSVQRETIARALRDQPEHTVNGTVGWLTPEAALGQRPEALAPIWVYDPRPLATSSSLHPRVARALVHTCLPVPGGRVVDPMAGGGVVGLEARKLGHTAWVSDLVPQAEFVATFDLLNGKRDLSDHLKAVIPDLPDEATGFADLLVLHPPLREELISEKGNLDRFVVKVLEASIATVKPGGQVALIVSVLEAPGALETLVRTLEEVVRAELPRIRRSGDAVKPTFGLYRHHVAVARDGRVGWHILIARKPAN